MITYQDLFLFCTFIIALISLLYQIFKGKIAATTANSDGQCCKALR